jgi:hypothetical protein
MPSISSRATLGHDWHGCPRSPGWPATLPASFAGTQLVVLPARAPRCHSPRRPRPIRALPCLVSARLRHRGGRRTRTRTHSGPGLCWPTRSLSSSVVIPPYLLSRRYPPTAPPPPPHPPPWQRLHDTPPPPMPPPPISAPRSPSPPHPYSPPPHPYRHTYLVPRDGSPELLPRAPAPGPRVTTSTPSPAAPLSPESPARARSLPRDSAYPRSAGSRRPIGRSRESRGTLLVTPPPPHPSPPPPPLRRAAFGPRQNALNLRSEPDRPRR